MFSPEILAQVTYRRTQQQARLADACVDAAQFFGVDEISLIAFCRTIGMR